MNMMKWILLLFKKNHYNYKYRIDFHNKNIFSEPIILKVHLSLQEHITLHNNITCYETLSSCKAGDLFDPDNI
jgi:hypothetical protein